jgi:hypothetical protein
MRDVIAVVGDGGLYFDGEPLSAWYLVLGTSYLVQKKTHLQQKKHIPNTIYLVADKNIPNTPDENHQMEILPIQN